MNSSTWHRLSEFCRNRESLAHQRELVRRTEWVEETEDGPGGDVDRRLTLFQSVFVYLLMLVVLGILFFSCRHAEGAEAEVMGQGPEVRGQRSEVRGQRSEVSVHALLDALAQIESGNNPRAIGRAGEVTEFQFLPGTLAAVNRDLARAGYQYGPHREPFPASVPAAYHLGSLASQFTLATGRVPNPQEIYALWNLGFSRYRRAGFSLARCPAPTRDAARRFGHLVTLYSRPALARWENGFPVQECREGVGIPGRSHKPLLAGSIPAPAPN